MACVWHPAAIRLARETPVFTTKKVNPARGDAEAQQADAA
jgi:hypothetical protein